MALYTYNAMIGVADKAVIEQMWVKSECASDTQLTRRRDYTADGWVA